MEPTFQIGETVQVAMVNPGSVTLQEGEIVVFRRPAEENCGGPPVTDLFKRVVGLPDETISLTEGYVQINGKRLDETWLPSSVQGTTFPRPGGRAIRFEPPLQDPG